MNEICVPLEMLACPVCGHKYRRIPACDLEEGATPAPCPQCDNRRPPLVDDTPERFAVLRLTTKEIADGLYRFNRIEHEGTTLYLVNLGLECSFALRVALACRLPFRRLCVMRYRAVVLEVKPDSVRTTYAGSGETPALALEEATKRAYLFRP